MNRFIFSIALIILFGVFSVGQVFAQSEVTSTATPSAKQEYFLPYPGILPDNPLWKLKALRDMVIGFLITDPLKEAEFNLLNADKRLNAGVSLIKKGKAELAVSTISKGENYFDQAIREITIAKSKGKDAKPILSKMASAAKKHQEVLSTLKKEIREHLKTSLQKELDRIINFEKSVESLSK